jgi:predicted DNA-binding transcriptional regulator AlpA
MNKQTTDITTELTPPPIVGDSPLPLVLTAEEAAAIFKKSARAWRNWDATGKTPRPIRIGRSTYWQPEELQAWIAAGCPNREIWEQQKRDQKTSDSLEKSRKSSR